MDILLGIATEIAIQMKGSLSFILGLGGLFSIVRAGLISIIGLGDLRKEVQQRRPSLALDVRNARRMQLFLFGVSTALFLFAIILYLWPLSGINATDLSTGKAILTTCQSLSVIGIALIAVVILSLDIFAKIHRSRLDRLIALD